jgi:RHS repeat-associated protein
MIYRKCQASLIWKRKVLVNAICRLRRIALDILKPYLPVALCALLLSLGTVALAAPNDPLESFTPNLGGSQFQPRGDEAGQYGVSEQTGSPSYRYRFTVPPGRLGVQADVALVYSPGARQIAEGWSLDVPRIDRITGESVSNDSTSGYSARLGKHRSRLIRTDNDVHTQPGSLTFRAAIDYDFVRYEYFQAGADPGRWEARAQDGTVYMFAASLGDGWGLTQMRDRFGNRLDIAYETLQVSTNPADKATYPVDFWYSANANAGLPAHAHLHLTWQTVEPLFVAAPNATARVSYRNGARTVEGAAFLRSAYTEVFDIPATHVPGRRIREYNFRYNTDPGLSCGGDAGRHRYLCEINERARARDGSFQSSPPVRFTYGNSGRTISANFRPWGTLPLDVFPTSGFTREYIKRNFGVADRLRRNSVLRTISIDVDGDGLVDILEGPRLDGDCNFRQTNYVWYRNTGAGFDSGHQFSAPNDFTRSDGSRALPENSRGTLACSLGAVRWYEPGIPPPGNPGEPFVEINRQFIDMNADDRPDIVEGLGAGDETGRCPSLNFLWRIHFNRGIQNNRITFDPPIQICAPIPVRQQGEGGEWDSYNLGDGTGDRLPDVIALDVDSNQTRPWRVWINTGNFQPQSPGDPIYPWTAAFEWVNSGGIRLNSRPIRSARNTILGQSNILRDVNGDGLHDLIVAAKDGTLVYANTGFGFEREPYRWDAFPTGGFVEQEQCSLTCTSPAVKTYLRHVIDFEGDGLTDLLRADEQGQQRIYPGGFQAVSEPVQYPDNLSLGQLRTFHMDSGFYHTGREFLDVTGDGRPDILEVVSDGGQNVLRVYTDTPSDDAPSLLRTVDNGRGLVVTYRYASSADSTVVTRHASRSNPDWIPPRLPFNVWVVKQLDVAVAGSPMSTTKYRYEDPVTLPDIGQRVGAQFRGFQSIWTTLPKTEADISAPQQLTRYSYQLDPSGLRTYVSHYEAFSTGTPDDPVPFQMVRRTVDQTYYSSMPLLDGATHFVFAAQQTSIECDGGLSTPCEQQTSHRRLIRQEFRQDSPARLSYLPFRRIEEAAGLAPRRTEFEWISVNQSDSYLVLPKRKTLAEYIPAFKEIPEQWLARTKEEFLYDGSSDPDQIGNLYGSPAKGLQTAHIVYRDPERDRERVVSGTAFDPQTGQVLKVIRPNNMTLAGPINDTDQFIGTRTEFDIWKLFPATVTNELGHQILSSFDIGTGNVLTRQGSNHKTFVAANGSKQTVPEETNYEYDGFGRLLTEKVSVDTGDSYTVKVRTNLHYDDEAPSSRVIRSRRIEWNEERYVVTTRRYDGADRLISEVMGRLDDDPRRSLETHKYFYDERGAITTIEGPNPQGDDRPLVKFRFQRDSRNRVTEMRNPDESIVHVFYDPWERRVRDEDGSVRREVSDGFGRLSQVDQDDGAGQTATTLYRYDAADRLTEIVNAGDTPEAALNPVDPTRITRFEHDGQGNRITIVRPRERRFEFVYDLNENLSRRVDADGRITEFHYDALNRLKEKVPLQTLLSGDEAENLGIGSVKYDYDDGEGFNLRGRLAKVRFFAGTQTTPYAEVTNGYDAQGNITSEAWSWNVGPTGAQQATLAHTYNALGAVATASYPNAISAAYTYDDRGLLASVSTGGQVLAGYWYNLARRVTQRTSDFSQQRTYTYDIKGRLQEDVLRLASRVALQRRYEYTKNGDVDSITAFDQLSEGPVNVSNWTYRFRYDGMHRLKHVDTGTTSWSGASYRGDFTYTPSGNLAFVSVEGPAGIFPRDVTYVYGNGTNADPQAVVALRPRSGESVMLENIYDSSGNLRQRTGANSTVTEFIYDVDAMARQTRIGDRSERYFYDHNHRRFLALASDGSWRFYLGGEYELNVAPGQRAGSAYVIGAGEAIARLTIETSLTTGLSQQTQVLLHHDRRGDLLTAIDTGGTVQAHFVYGAFGEILSALSTENQWWRTFNGKEQDRINNFYYYGYRYYDPLTLRWTTVDPLYRFTPDIRLVEPQRLNLYSFSLNNPERYHDPDGLDGKKGDETHCEGGTSTTCEYEEARKAGLPPKRAALYAKAARFGDRAQQGVVRSTGYYQGSVWFSSRALQQYWNQGKVDPEVARWYNQIEDNPRIDLVVTSNIPINLLDYLQEKGGAASSIPYPDLNHIWHGFIYIDQYSLHNIDVTEFWSPYGHQKPGTGFEVNMPAILAHEVGHIIGVINESATYPIQGLGGTEKVAMDLENRVRAVYGLPPRFSEFH